MADRVTFTKASAERIAQAVRIVEAGNRDTGGLPTAPRFGSGGGGGAPIRLCGWTANWYLNASTLVTFSSGGATATAENVFFGVGPGAGWVAKDAGVWKLISCKLSDQPGFDGTETQLLGHIAVTACEGECSDNIYANTLQWYSVTTCATATA